MSNEEKEPFLVSVIPFAGLGLLLLLALAWRYLPERDTSGADAERPAAAAIDPRRADEALRRWKGARRQEVPLDATRDFSLGSPDARVTLVEFSDFECPFCKTATRQVKDVVERFGDDVRIVFKNFPLDIACNTAMSQQLHANACRAAYLARCAGAQDEAMFWRAHDMMFAAEQLTGRVLEEIPDELGLDTARLESCMADPATEAAVKADIAEAHALELTSTPSFFINDRRVSDYRDGSLSKIVEEALAAPAPGTDSGS